MNVSFYSLLKNIQRCNPTAGYFDASCGVAVPPPYGHCVYLVAPPGPRMRAATFRAYPPPSAKAAGKSCAAGTLAAGVCSVFWAAFEQHLPSISNC